MASITREIALPSAADAVWAALRDVGAVHRRVAPGFVRDARMDGNARLVTFANGMSVRERIIDVDDARRRLVYAAVGGRTTHHNAAVEVFAAGAGSRLVWTTDLAPDEMAPIVEEMMVAALAVMTVTLADPPA